MERIDRQQRFIKKPIPAAGDGLVDPHHGAQARDPDSHWLSHAMAMWIEQDESLRQAGSEPRPSKTVPR